MKKLLKISFLLAVLCFAVPVYADGDLPIGTKTCTQNCALYGGTTTNPTASDDKNSEDSSTEEIYSWIYEQFSDLIG